MRKFKLTILVLISLLTTQLEAQTLDWLQRLTKNYIGKNISDVKDHIESFGGKVEYSKNDTIFNGHIMIGSDEPTRSQYIVQYAFITNGFLIVRAFHISIHLRNSNSNQNIIKDMRMYSIKSMLNNFKLYSSVGATSERLENTDKKRYEEKWNLVLHEGFVNDNLSTGGTLDIVEVNMNLNPFHWDYYKENEITLKLTFLSSSK